MEALFKYVLISIQSIYSDTSLPSKYQKLFVDTIAGEGNSAINTQALLNNLPRLHALVVATRRYKTQAVSIPSNILLPI